jgi:hypothetical protein
MRRLQPLAIGAATLCALTWQPGPAHAQTNRAAAGAPAEVVAAQPQPDLRPIIVGLGAIAGVVIFNVAMLGVEALPGGMAYAAGASVPAEMSVAMSRVYATTSAVIGGWVGYYGYWR